MQCFSAANEDHDADILYNVAKIESPSEPEVIVKDIKKEDLKELCEEADKYGIKIIADIVFNHMATTGGLDEWGDPEVDPEVLIYKLEGDYKRNIANATSGLKEYIQTRQVENYAIINDKETIMEKAKKIIRNAKQEIFINTDIDVNELKDEFKMAAANNVRIIIFSFVKQELQIEGVEIYSHDRERTTGNTNTRLMLVADDDMVLIADSSGREKWTGTVSNNRLMKSIVREHIHNDIYKVIGKKNS